MEQYEFDAFQIRNIFDVLKDLLTHCWLVFHNGELVITNIDPEKIIHVHCRLVPNSMSCREGDHKFIWNRFEFSTYAQTIYKMFRSTSPGQKATISVDRDNNQLLFGISKCGFSLVSKLTSLSMDKMSLEVCNPVMINVQDFATTYLHKIMYTLSSVSRMAEVNWNTCGIVFKANDNIQTDVKVEHAFQNVVETPQSFEFTIKIIIKYLEKFCNKNLGKRLSLGLGENGQIIAAYDLQNGDLRLTMASLG
jgi:hypothetical protein